MPTQRHVRAPLHDSQPHWVTECHWAAHGGAGGDAGGAGGDGDGGNDGGSGHGAFLYRLKRLALYVETVEHEACSMHSLPVAGAYAQLVDVYVMCVHVALALHSSWHCCSAMSTVFWRNPLSQKPSPLIMW